LHFLWEAKIKFNEDVFIRFHWGEVEVEISFKWILKLQMM